jgi:hypothetical protein
MIVEIEDSVAELVAIRAEETNKAKICLVRLRGLCGRPLPESYRSERIGPTIEADLQPRQIDRGSRAETDQGPSVAPGDIWEWSVTIQPTLVDRGEVIRRVGNFVLALKDDRMMDNALKRFVDSEPFELPLEAE